MERVVIRYPYDWFGTRTIVADENGVTNSYRNLVASRSEHYAYSDLRAEPLRFEEGDKGWNQAATFFFVFAVVSSMLRREYGTGLFLIFLLLAAAAFGLRMRIRRWLAYRDRDGFFAFVVMLPEGQALADYVAAQIASLPALHGAEAEPPAT